ncbi:hypothetical protein BDV93DRAFT_582471 [Ceratobasidium sp. AG-I]|nr:hypothetical protein BDV93DRAFT_582471 [Ceratobasidium sp. AG-I]
MGLLEQFQETREIHDLDQAIYHLKGATVQVAEGSQELAGLLETLGDAFIERFRLFGDAGNLEQAASCWTKVTEIAPGQYPNPPKRLIHLGGSLFSNDLSASIHSFRSAAKSTTGPPKIRFDAALHWARHSPSDDTANIVAAYNQVMKILPQLVWLGTPVESRYSLILDVAGSVSTEAASVAIAMHNYSLALEWLEEGRSIVWKQMLQLRTPIDDLFAVDSALATQLKQVAHDLDYASSPKPQDQTDSSDDSSPEQAARHHRGLAALWEGLVDKARDLPGFEAFLRPQKASELMRSARFGPVVVINIHESRCDALIIQPGLTEILHKPLIFSSKQAADCRVKLIHFVRGRGLDVRGVRVHRPDPKDEFRKALDVLRKDVVKPILDSLGYLVCDLPHITWCTTGPLSFLPLHAAGDYASQEMIFDYVISSYTPTLSALLSSGKPSDAFSGILAVGQESTLGMSPLPGTVAELTRIQETAQGHAVTRVDRDLATPAAVMAGMEEHSWVHLACHASQNPINPLQSAFYLHGGKLDLATITQKHLKNADLAFLSACQTATGDESLSEEAVHLAAGMLMAGYKSVIATMWSIGDDDAPLIAEKVYEHLLEGGIPDSRRAAAAVHKATACLRAKVGVDAFEKWVPYIHIGQ